MKTSDDYKNQALDVLRGRWGSAVVAVLISACIVGWIPMILMYNVSVWLGRICYLAMMPMLFGEMVYFLYVARHQDANWERLFDGFRNYKNVFLTILLQGIYASLWSLLLIVPGIVKMYSYSMTFYVMRDNPELSKNAAIERSMAMMEGHKLDLFLLDLSMIGWVILSILTMGVGFFFLAPYIFTAHACFYDDLRSECIEAEEAEIVE